MTRNLALTIVGLLAASCSPNGFPEPAFHHAAMRSIRACLNSGRDCGTSDQATVQATPEVRERLRERCLKRVIKLEETTEPGLTVTLTCRVRGVEAIYQASADRASARDMRDPVVTYRYRIDPRDAT